MIRMLKRKRKKKFGGRWGVKRYIFGLRSMAYVIISKTQSNLLFTLTDLHGNIICVVSSGCVGMRSPRRKRSFWAADKIGRRLGMYALDFNIRMVLIVLKVPVSGHVDAVSRGLVSCGLRLLSLKDHCCLAHNGCRRKKIRRV